ncbi:MAG: hypothetical protein GKS06_17505 [Acidobacteria bacterium]|nr:hypothetical protein [Acidobacteriota bacterium]
MTRRRFYGMCAFLALALGIAMVASARGIEQRLLLAGQAAIAQANIPYYDLEIDGRDAVVGGFIAEGTDVETLRRTLQRVNGIREVRLEGVVGRLADSDLRAQTLPEARATIEAELRIYGAGCLIRMNGSVPDNGFVDELQAAFVDSELCGPVEASLRANDSVKSAAWTDDARTIVEIVTSMRGIYRLTAYGSTIRVFGASQSDSVLDRLDELSAKLSGVDFQLVASRGDSSGGAP